jgi:alcohol dehydrogenase class IV
MEAKVQRMADAMDLENTSVDSFISEIERMLDDINIPRSLGDIGVPTECAARIAEKALQDSAAGTNPRPASLNEMRDLVENAIARAR